MRVELKRPNGWKVKPSTVESRDEVRYGMVYETRIKKVAVLVCAGGSLKCSKCKHHDPSTNCKHEAAVEDRIPSCP